MVTAKPQVYVPVATSQPMALIVRTSGDPKMLVPAVMAALQRIDPTLPLYNVKPMTEVLAETLSQQRFTTSLLIAFAALGLVLAGIGFHGVLSYIVSQRTHEFGIRLALGAPARHLRAIVVRQALAPVAVGLAVGVAAAVTLTRAMATLLYGSAPSMPFRTLQC
jgi:putative ABC transport system permease protein